MYKCLPDALVLFCGFFPTRNCISLIKGYCLFCKHFLLWGKKNIKLWILPLYKHKIIYA